MTRKLASPMFFVAGVFNTILTLLFILKPELAHSLLMKGPTPDAFGFLYFLAALVFTFGVGYFWAAKDIESNRSVIKMAILGKLLVFATAIWLVMIDRSGKILLMTVGSADLLFAWLFYSSLKI